MSKVDMAEDLYKLAIQLEDGLLADIELCKTREEHIRLTARANAAGKLRGDLQQLVVKLSTTSGA
jgi:hypothetical protein